MGNSHKYRITAHYDLSAYCAPQMEYHEVERSVVVEAASSRLAACQAVLEGKLPIKMSLPRGFAITEDNCDQVVDFTEPSYWEPQGKERWPEVLEETNEFIRVGWGDEDNAGILLLTVERIEE